MILIILEDLASNLMLPVDAHNNARTTDVVLLHQNGIGSRANPSPQNQQLQHPSTSQSLSNNIHHLSSTSSSSTSSNQQQTHSSDLLNMTSGSATTLSDAGGIHQLNRDSPPSESTLSGMEGNLRVTLDDRELWLRFQNLTNEMIVTKNGR